MTPVIQQSVRFRTSPKELFEMYLDSEKHSESTGARATMRRKTGGSFRAFAGTLAGRNLLVIPGRQIVQRWRAAHWKKEDWSILVLTFSKTVGGCQVDLVHSGVPSYDHQGVRRGWPKFYWKPWKKYLANGNKAASAGERPCSAATAIRSGTPDGRPRVGTAQCVAPTALALILMVPSLLCLWLTCTALERPAVRAEGFQNRPKRSLIKLSAAHKLNDLELVACRNRGVCPLRTWQDGAVIFNRDAPRLESQLVKQGCNGYARGDFLLFPIDLNNDGILHITPTVREV